MPDPNKDRRDFSEIPDLVEGAVEFGAELGTEGVIDVAIEGVSAVAEAAGELVGGFLDGI